MAASYSASPMVKSAVVLPPASPIRPKTLTMASQIRGRAGALKFNNNKPYQLSMKSQTLMIPRAISSSSSSLSNSLQFQAEKFMSFNHKPYQLSMKSPTQMKPMAMSSPASSSSNIVRSHANDPRYPQHRTLFQWLFYFVVAVCTLAWTPFSFFSSLLGLKTKILLLSVILHDEDGHLIKKFDYIRKKNEALSTYKDALDETVKCLLENADSCLFSASVVGSNYLQLDDNMHNLYHDDFTYEAFAEDDINCTQIQLFLSTFDEISDENIHTIEDFKAFLRKLGSIKEGRIGTCLPFNYYQRKGPIQRHRAYNRYSHLRVPV